MVAILVDRDVDVDNVSFFKGSEVGNAVADNFID